MKNVIQLIERLGETSDMSVDNYRIVVEQAEIDETLRVALLNRDEDKLRELLGNDHSLMCIVAPADDDDDAGDDSQSEAIAV